MYCWEFLSILGDATALRNKGGIVSGGKRRHVIREIQKRNRRNTYDNIWGFREGWLHSVTRMGYFQRKNVMYCYLARSAESLLFRQCNSILDAEIFLKTVSCVFQRIMICSMSWLYFKGGGKRDLGGNRNEGHLAALTLPLCQIASNNQNYI